MENEFLATEEIINPHVLSMIDHLELNEHLLNVDLTFDDQTHLRSDAVSYKLLS